MPPEHAITLYDLERAGNCYKIRLFLSILGISYTKAPVNLGAGEHRRPEFLALNPNGLVPVLTDGATTLYDSAAILSYLARKYADAAWFPNEPERFALVVRWLAFEQNEVRYGLTRARALALKLSTQLTRTGTLEESLVLANLALEILERRLAETEWLAGTNDPTIADIACYPYTALAGDAGLSLDPYPGIRRWIAAIERLPGYVPLPRVKPA